jgi:hypothetical protein
MCDLHWETISPSLRKVLSGFGQTSISSEFYLAGGTALALQIGHRVSVDLVFFSATQDVPSIVEPLSAALRSFSPVLTDSAWGNLVFLADGFRVGFYGYGYNLVAPIREAESVKIASIPDIALMKLDALLSRASRKDFYDLYAICQSSSLRTFLNLAPQKYPGMRDFEAQVARHLVYFERAERETQPTLLQPIEWETVKTWFRQQAIEIEKSWLK